MKCIVCNEEIEEENMSSALSLGSFPPATAKEVPVHVVCPHYNGWKFYGGARACQNCGGLVNTSTGYRICENGCGGPV